MTRELPPGPAEAPGRLRREPEGGAMRAATLLLIFCILGFVFLYAPIVSLIVFSFNESKLVTVWGGFSTKWYGELFRDPQILGAAWISLQVAVASATLAVVLGTLAAYVLTRFGRFRARALLTGMSTAPLVMPEVITGLSLLLLFVAMEQLIGWPAGARQADDHHRPRHLLHGLRDGGGAVAARRASTQSLEEAAMDLGARPVRVFFDVTMPVIAPALVAGWLLAFTLSLDDLVVASFVTGPGRLDAADGDLLQGAARGQPGHQRAGDHHHRDRGGRRRRSPSGRCGGAARRGDSDGDGAFRAARRCASTGSR